MTNCRQIYSNLIIVQGYGLTKNISEHWKLSWQSCVFSEFQPINHPINYNIIHEQPSANNESAILQKTQNLYKNYSQFKDDLSNLIQTYETDFVIPLPKSNASSNDQW